MGFSFEKFKKELISCYFDKEGNLIAVLGLTNGKEEHWYVAYIFKNGDVKPIEDYNNFNDAHTALQRIAKENNLKLKE